ncbi:MAG: hypothetical protein QNK18_17710 [Gammaproteobacteria bacterium]|nr:hypothetical protein [Gammaproteobacteria bacterium]
MNDGVQGFIRGTLGCTCPDDVFANIASARDVAIGSVILNRRIDVGRRLLVYLLESDDPDLLSRQMPELIDHGTAERNREGFNRFRLVVASRNTECMSRPAQQAFDETERSDERIHLHVVDRSTIARL